MNHDSTWHADPSALRDYAEGSADAAVAWSVETHLPICSTCRAILAELIQPADAGVLREARAAMALPAQAAGRRTPHLALVRGVLGPWWAWGGLMVLAVIGVALAGQIRLPEEQVALGLSWALALSPLVPVGMVAAVYGVADGDPAAQATPRGGLELVLIRTASILGLTIPVLTLVMWASGTFLVVWLLPALGLSIGAIALGSWLEVERAAVGLTTGWATVVALTMFPSSIFVETLAPLIHPEGVALWLWALVVLAGIFVIWQRNRFDIWGRNR